MAGYQSVLSQLVAAVVGTGPFYYVTIGSILIVLALSANTGFADFPRLCRVIAQDGFLPRVFASRGRRLVYSLGIFVLTGLSAFLLDHLRRHHRSPDPAVRRRRVPGVHALAGGDGRATGGRATSRARTPAMLINGLGALATGVTLVVVLVSKFAEGAWVMMLLIPALLAVFLMVARHYRAVAVEIANPLPLNVTNIQPPIVIIPMSQWNRMSQKGLRFALKLSPRHPRRAGAGGRAGRERPVGEVGGIRRGAGRARRTCRFRSW